MTNNIINADNTFDDENIKKKNSKTKHMLVI